MRTPDLVVNEISPHKQDQILKSPRETQKLIKQQVARLHKIKLLCVGDYEVGKSTFLMKYTQPTRQYQQEQQCLEVFVKMLRKSTDQCIGVEILELPSTYNLSYLQCYLINMQIDGLIFCYDMKIRKSQNLLLKMIKHISNNSIHTASRLPLLMVGLKANKLDHETLHEEKCLVFRTFKNILDVSTCCLFVNQSLDQKTIAKIDEFALIISNKNSDYSQRNKYCIIQGYYSYVWLYDYTQLLFIIKNYWCEWVSRKLTKQKQKPM